MWVKERNSSPELMNPPRDTPGSSAFFRQRSKLSPLILYPDSLASLGGLEGGAGLTWGKRMFWLSRENVGYFCHLSPKEGAVGGSSQAWWSGGEYYSFETCT